jgi:hypothetical protein
LTGGATHVRTSFVRPISAITTLAQPAHAVPTKKRGCLAESVCLNVCNTPTHQTKMWS